MTSVVDNTLYLLVVINIEMSNFSHFAVFPAVRAQCADKDTRCKSWAEAGECTSNPNYMIPNCKKSCNKCAGRDTSSLASFLMRWSLRAMSHFSAVISFQFLSASPSLLCEVEDVQRPCLHQQGKLISSPIKPIIS